MTAGVVSAIHLHPIKSCHRVEVRSATVGPVGLVGDREWQLSTPTGPLTQRQRAVLATVQPQLTEGGLRITAPGRPTIEVARPVAADTTTLALVGVEAGAADAGDEAAAWFSALLAEATDRRPSGGGDGADSSDDETAVRLVALPVDGAVPIPAELAVAGPAIAFGDLAPVLVANTASLRWLAERADEPFGMERFRPNLVVDTDEPFAEDTWARFRLGDSRLDLGAPWPRCTIPQVDQETGRRGREPARVLRAHRWCTHAPDVPLAFRPVIENSGVFGIGCTIGPVGSVVSVGDRLEVEASTPPLLPNPALT